MLRHLPRGLTLGLVGGLVAIAVVSVLAIQWWRDAQRSDLARAAALAPASTQRLAWTDWRGVRRTVGADLGANPSPDDLTAFLDEAFAEDLSTSSALVESAPTMQEKFRFSPATIDWELFAQGPEGAADFLGMPDGTDFDAIGDDLESIGFTRPAQDDGVWVAGADALARVGPGLTPELQFITLLADSNLVVASDSESYLRTAVQSATGEADGLTSVEDVVGDAGTPLVAAVYTGAYACEHLAMAAADDTDQAQADTLIEQAGGVHPLSGFAMATQPAGDITVSMSFETDEHARDDAESRGRLAGGPAPGQGGSFPDRFTVESATSTGRVVRLDLQPLEGQYVLSDLTSGPVLFATC